MKQLLGIVVLEHAVVIGVSVAVGALAGARLGSTIMPYLANSGEGVEVTPPMILIIDWGNFALAFGILGIVLVAVIAAISLAVYRMSIHSAMRMGDCAATLFRPTLRGSRSPGSSSHRQCS